MSADSPVSPSLDQMLAGIRTQLEAEFRAFAEQAARAALAERERAVAEAAAEVRRHAADEMAQLRRVGDAQLNELQQLRQRAEAEVTELRRNLDARHAQLREVQGAADAAAAELERVRRANAALEVRTGELERAVDAAGSQLRQLQQSTDARLAEVAAERDRLRQELGHAQRQVHELEKRELERREHDERAAAAHARTHVAESIRVIDLAGSLGDTLDRLTEAALTHCDRAALLIVKGDRLRPWRTFGFDETDGDVRVDLSADAAGIAGAVARQGRVLSHAGNGSAAPLPPFASSTDVFDASAFPVTVAGAVVAVLYVDRTEEPPRDSIWTADIDVLVRHASRVLEVTTLQQAIGVRPIAVARPSQAASPFAGTPPGGTGTGGLS